MGPVERPARHGSALRKPLMGAVRWKIAFFQNERPTHGEASEATRQNTPHRILILERTSNLRSAGKNPADTHFAARFPCGRFGDHRDPR